MARRSRQAGAAVAGCGALVTVARAAAQVDVAPRVVRRWVQEGLLPAHRASGFGRRPRVDMTDVDRLVTGAPVDSDEADERLWSPGLIGLPGGAGDEKRSRTQGAPRFG